MSDGKTLSVFESEMLAAQRAQTAALIELAEATKLQSAHLADQARREANAYSNAAESNTRAIEDTARIAGERKTEFHRVAIGATLDRVSESPSVVFYATLECTVFGPSEMHVGKRRVFQLRDVDMRDAEAVLRADIAGEFSSVRKDAERHGDQEVIRQIDASIDGYSAKGLKFRRSNELILPAFRRIIGKHLEDLLLAGTVRLVESMPE